MQTHDQAVVSQFDPQAEAYLASAVHATGPDLAQARHLLAHSGLSTASMLDVGCGAGHLSFALAPYFAQVTATDLSASMLDTVLRTAAQRSLSQIQVRHANAQALPFADHQFDLVCSRYSAHHWQDVPAALREMRRVARPGGMLLIIDLLGDESPMVDTHLQAIELLRDPGHVRDYSPSQWRSLLQAAGFELQQSATWRTRLEFRPWIERMRPPAAGVTAIRMLLDGACREVRQGLAVEADGSFTAATGLFWAGVPAGGFAG